MTAPITTLVNLFSTLNMEFDIVAADALYDHTRIIKDPNENTNKNKDKAMKYYSTYRTAENDIYKWKKQLSKEQIRYVEENCYEFMEKVGYNKTFQAQPGDKNPISKALQIKSKGSS